MKGAMTDLKQPCMSCDCGVLAELRFCDLYSHFMEASDYHKTSTKQGTALPSRCRTAGGLNLCKEIHSSRSKVVMVQWWFNSHLFIVIQSL
jgi:hypothetical protein